MQAAKQRLVTCPTCGIQTEYSLTNPYRPFCSQRCKLIDLGQWASENYRIPETQPKEDPEDAE
ncbi:DNA gyrase inhibitor YacG [mine drainage metagenome]|uniref:DNA gyrase inhibitor YacG n=1 Tax=mine drainage metagenome TaxID=410659 RepID=A0A1J5QJY9_9ZZZZ